MKTLVFAAAIAALTATTASAADIAARPYTKAPAISPVYNWTGFYVGVNVGYGFGDRNADFTANDPATVSLGASTGTFLSTRYDSDGVLGGVQIGYNWQVSPNWLLGIEADFQGSDLKGGNSAPFLSGLSAAPYATSAQQNVDWFGTLRARVGWLPNDKFLAFATGGLAYGGVKNSASVIRSTLAGDGVSIGGFSYVCAFNPVGTACLAGQSNDVQVGYTVGGGFEYSLWQNLTLKAEYLYVNLGRGDVNASSFAVLNPGDIPGSVKAGFGDLDFHVVRTGLNYRF